MAKAPPKKTPKRKKNQEYFAPAPDNAPKATRLSRLQARYIKEVVPALKEKLKLNNIMEVPKLKSITVNVCTKEAVADPKVLNTIQGELAIITGQKSVLTKARKSIAGFKLREGMPIGARVTLRRKLMYEFLDRLISISLPRVRDFSGISTKSFDGRGNYCLGIREQIIFPEIDYDKIDKMHGMNITIVTSAKDNNTARELLSELGMPFKK